MRVSPSPSSPACMSNLMCPSSCLQVCVRACVCVCVCVCLFVYVCIYLHRKYTDTQYCTCSERSLVLRWLSGSPDTHLHPLRRRRKQERFWKVSGLSSRQISWEGII